MSSTVNYKEVTVNEWRKLYTKAMESVINEDGNDVNKIIHNAIRLGFARGVLWALGPEGRANLKPRK